MAIKKSPSLLRTEAKLKKLQKEIKLTEKRVKQLTAKDEKSAKAAAKKAASKKSKPSPKKSAKKVTAKKTAPKTKKTATKKVAPKKAK